MKYMVFIIYLITATQFINCKPIVKNGIQHRGYNFYKFSGIIYIIVGMFGMSAVNIFMRDMNIIPQVYVWVALIGFAN